MTLTADKVRELARAELVRRGVLVAKRDCEAEPRIVSEDGVTTYALHAGQLRSWSSIKRIVAVFAGWQSGKTVLGPWWLLREMQRRGPGDYAVIAPDHPMILNKAKPEMAKAFAGLYHSSGNEWILTTAGEVAIFGAVQKAPTRILYRHAQSPEAIEAFTLKGLWIDEPGQIADAVWESIQARCAVHQARMLMTSRPYEHNWYVRDIWGEKRDDVDVVNFRSIDNPSFPAEEYELQKLLLPDWKFRMKYDGVPTRPAGVVYDCFDAENIVEPFDVPRAWPLYLGLDFGLVNTAAVIIAEELKTDWLGHWTDEPTGNYYLIGTYHAGQAKTAKEHLSAVRAVADSLVLGGSAQRPTAVGGSHQESGWRESWSLSGLGVSEPSITKVESQIATLYAAFKTKKLKVFSTCTKFISDVHTFAYELDDDGEATEKLKDEAKFHRLAACRYISTRLFKLVERVKAPVMRAGIGSE